MSELSEEMIENGVYLKRKLNAAGVFTTYYLWECDNCDYQAWRYGNVRYCPECRHGALRKVKALPKAQDSAAADNNS